LPGDGDGLGLVPDEDGLGVGDGLEAGGGFGVVLDGGGLAGGLLAGGLLAGGGAWLAVAVAVGDGEAIGAFDFGGEGTVLSEIVGVASGATLPDGSVDDELTAAARTAACGRLAQAAGAALLCAAVWASVAARTLELRASSRKPARPPTAAGRATDDAFTSTPSPSRLRRSQDWCSPCPSQRCPCKLRIPSHCRSTPMCAGRGTPPPRPLPVVRPPGRGCWKDHLMSVSDILTRAAGPPDQVLHYGPRPDQFADLRLPVRSGEAENSSSAAERRPEWPVVIFLHGGFWRSAFDRTHTGPLAEALAAAGFAVCTPEFRRTGQPGGGWPGSFDDVAAAVDVLPGLVAAAVQEAGGRADPGRLVLAGHSAGGHLALWAAGREPCRRAGGGRRRRWPRGWSAWRGCATWRLATGWGSAGTRPGR
jgi:hypothetical protein